MNLDLFKDILSIDSTSGMERTLALWLNDHLEAPSKQLMEVGDGTLNLLLSWGTPRVVFCTHMDTVPPYIAPRFAVGSAPRMTPCGSRPISPSDPASAERSDERLNPLYDVPTIWGRGTCDAKGQLIALYTACKELESEGADGFGLLILAGEETGSWGAKAFAKTDFKAPFLIVGEPTENKMISASKGTKSYDLRFIGEAFHSGYPEYGVSAVELFNEFYNKLKATDFGDDPVLGKTTWNIGLLKSDNPQNILSPELTCRLYFRTTFVSDEKVVAFMEEIAGQARNEGDCHVGNEGEGQARNEGDCHVGNDGGCQARGSSHPRPDRGSLEVVARGGDSPAKYVVLPGFESAPAAFGTDAPHLTNFGHKIICGPGTVRVAHRDDEHIILAELEEAVKLYKSMWCVLQTADNQ